MTDYDALHAAILAPCVRIRAGRAGGSGTVVYSKPNGDGGHSVYLTTNHHVVDGLISVEKKFDPRLGKDVKRETRELARAEFFNYRWSSRSVGENAVDAEIVAYDSDEDLALLKLRADSMNPPVASLLPADEVKNLRIGMPVYTVGAGLGEPPVTTGGFLSQFNRQIDGKEYWINTSAAIYGNSGGATFLQETCQFIGVPARIAVTGFLGQTAVTHLQYTIPIDRIYSFLDEQGFRFIFDNSHTEAGDAEDRKKAKEAAGKEEE